ncbi:MAG TPA: substrate-binding domain-containing protein, partial [Trebonia sp.]
MPLFRSPKRGRIKAAALLGIACVGLAAAGCSSSSSSSSSTPSTSGSAAAPASSSGTPKVSGTASVAYASSLQYLNEKVAGPAFTQATGAGYSGQGNASGALEKEIAAGEIHPNVFEAVGGDNITPLEPQFTKWYVQYAGTSMVLAYN